MAYKSSDIPCYHFMPRKYGRDLLMDLGRVESLKNFVLDNAPHQISFYEILLIERGRGSFALDDHRTVLAPGTVIFTSPGQVRRWEARQVKGYTLFFEKDFLNLFFTDELFLYRFQYFNQYQRSTGMRLAPADFRQALKLVQGIETEFEHLQIDSVHLLRAIVYQLLVILNRHYAAAHGIQGDTHIHPDFYRFRSLLEKNFKTVQRVSHYTAMLQISTTHLNRICRQYSGLSAQQVIHQRLISAIKRELRSVKSVKEIAYTFEFSDPSNFNRFFKKLTGVTAQQYREGA